MIIVEVANSQNRANEHYWNCYEGIAEVDNRLSVQCALCLIDYVAEGSPHNAREYYDSGLFGESVEKEYENHHIGPSST
jgi:hypothetical protein